MLTLVRHAATAWSGVRYCGRTDLPISPVGREQLGPLVQYVSSVARAGTTVIASPALRSRETAAAIMAALGGAIAGDERLREIDFGDAEGLTFRQVERHWPRLASELLHDDPHVDWPRGERWSDFAARVVAAWRDHSAGPHDAILVTHGGPLRLLLELALVGSASRVPTDLGPAHVVVLEDERGWAVRASWSPASVTAVLS
jgi:broad specificity phosphatase PhoE